MEVNDDGLPNRPPPVIAGSTGWDAERSSLLSLPEAALSIESSSTFSTVVVASPLGRLLLLDDDVAPREDSSSSIFLPFNLVQLMGIQYVMD